VKREVAPTVRQYQPLVWLLVAAVPVFVVGLGANSIWDHNEAFYVETPRQMILRGDYVTPYFNDAERLNKPVLSYWIVAGLYHLFGISVGVERLGIAVGALGIVAAAFVIGRAWRSTSTGVLAALIVATAPRVVMHSRRIFIDVYVTLFMSLSLACFVLAERHPRHRERWLLAMYVCIGLGVLTKGPVALVLPALVCALWLTIERRWADVRRLSLVPGLLIIAAIVVPWYAALYLRHGWGPVLGFFQGENVDRFMTSMVPGDARPWWWYSQVLLTDLFPWAPLLLVPLVSAWQGRRQEETDVQARLRRLLWCWVVGITVAFSLSATKQDLYIFPVIAASAALIAETLLSADLGGARRGLTGLLGTSAVLCATAGAAITYLFGSGVYGLDGAPLAGALCVAGGLAAAAAVVAGRLRAGVLTLAATFVAFNYVFVLQVLPSVERFKPSPAFADIVASRGSEGDRIGSYEYMLSSLVYYGSRPVHHLATPDDVRGFFEIGSGWVVMRREQFDAVAPEIPDLCIAASRPVLNAQIGDLLERRAPAEVVLVTNRCG
jgi:4-amino-4-deoxy-L-arabinose transferase-like glycosyltransferase